jgi:hypothetical protein
MVRNHTGKVQDMDKHTGLTLDVEELEGLEAPGFGEFLAGLGSGIAGAAAAFGAYGAYTSASTAFAIAGVALT